MLIRNEPSGVRSTTAHRPGLEAERRLRGRERVREGDGAGILERGPRRAEQVRLGLNATQPDGLDERVEEGGDFGAALGARAVMISCGR